MDMLVLRKVAQAASAGYVKSSEFDNFWPLQKKDDTPTPSWRETPPEERKRILDKLRGREHTS